MKMPFTICKYLHSVWRKCVKCVNEMTDDVIHSTQYYIMCINRTILANLQCRSLILGRMLRLKPEMPFILGRSGTQYVAMRRSGTQYVAMGMKLLSSNYCGAQLVESYCKESNISDSNWLRYLFSSF